MYSYSGYEQSRLLLFYSYMDKIMLMFFSNPGDRVQKRWRTTGPICPVLSTRIWTLSPGLESNHKLKCWSLIFQTILTYMNMLENCQNNISVYGCSPIQGTKFYSCWSLMKPGSQSGSYSNSTLFDSIVKKRLESFSQKYCQFGYS